MELNFRTNVFLAWWYLFSHDFTSHLVLFYVSCWIYCHLMKKCCPPQFTTRIIASNIHYAKCERFYILVSQFSPPNDAPKPIYITFTKNHKIVQVYWSISNAGKSKVKFLEFDGIKNRERKRKWGGNNHMWLSILFLALLTFYVR